VDILGARDELAAALVAGAVPIADGPGDMAPPSGIIYGDGVDLGHVARGQVAARFRVTLVSGAWDQSAATRDLTTLVQATVAAIRGLTGWRLVAVQRDGRVSVAGGDMLATDVSAERMVDI